MKREREGRARPLLRLDRILAGSYNLIDTLKKFISINPSFDVRMKNPKRPKRIF